MRTALILATLALSGAVGVAQDASSVLREVDGALGASSLKAVRYSGSGFAYNFLQNWRPDGPYPKFYAKYTRTIDFDKGVSREELTRSQFENPGAVLNEVLVDELTRREWTASVLIHLPKPSEQRADLLPLLNDGLSNGSRAQHFALAFVDS